MTIISTSTSAFFDRSTMDISALRQQAEDLQTSMARGQRLSRSSDDPVAASRLRSLARADTLDQIDEVATNRATTDLTLADSALSRFADFVTRVQELATQAASTTLTDAQRSGIGVEVEQIHQNLVALANTRDSAGHALFGGEAAGDAYTLDPVTGAAGYVGVGTAGEVALGDGQSVGRGLTGPEFLKFNVNGTPTDLMALVKDLGDSLQGGTGGAAAASGALTALGAGLDSITTAQTVIGSRLAWIDLNTERRVSLGELRSTEESAIGGTDLTETIAHLQNTLLVLEASQSSFAKLANLSLFNLLN